MKKGKFLNSFKSRKFKYGGYATLITVIVLVGLVVINLVADLIPLKWDLTTEGLYSLSEQTLNMLENLDEDINIYQVGEMGNTDAAIEEIVQNYSDKTSHISVSYIDPVKDPMGAQKYTSGGEDSLSAGDIIVEQGEKFRVIKYSDMYNFTYDQNNQPQVTSLQAEQRLTSAILFVTGSEAPLIYQLEGHGESALNSEIANQIELENFELQAINLVGQESVPEDADILLINSPKSDLSAEEQTIIREYLENQGRAIFMIDALTEDLPNFQLLLNSYGVDTTNSLVLEGEQGSFIPGNPLYVIPEYESHDIVEPIMEGDSTLYMPGAQAINILDNLKTTLTVTPFLGTSDAAYARPANSEATTMEKDAGDIEGPFNLAVAVEDSVYNVAANESYLTRLVVIGNSSFLETGAPATTDIFLNSLNWIFEREETISVRPKSLEQTSITINQAQFMIYGGLAVIVIPLICIIAGVVVWFRRRNL